MKKLKNVSLISATAASILLSLLQGSAHAAGIPVTSTSDADTADSACTLREAITSVNNQSAYHGCAAGSGNDYIFLPVGTITLNSSLPTLTRAVILSGNGYLSTIIDAKSKSGTGPLTVQTTATIRSLALQNFNLQALKVAAGADLTLDAAAVSGSGAPTSVGGCIANYGSLLATNVKIEGCDGFRAGALLNEGVANLNFVTITKSHTEHSLIWNTNQLGIYDSTVGGNKVGEGGTILNFGGSTYINQSTIAYNTLPLNGGGTLNNSSGSITVSNTALIGNSSPSCKGTISSGGYLAADVDSPCPHAAGEGDFTTGTTAAKLQPGPAESTYLNMPRAAGGVGRVYLPDATSSLLNRVPSDLCSLGDQRGIARALVTATCDVGAVERTDALLVVGNTTLSTGDGVLKTQLEALGFSVTVVKDTSATAASANGKTLVVISESVGSTNVNRKFLDVLSGVIVLEPSVLDDMMMTAATTLGATNATTARVTGILSATGIAGDLLLTDATTGFGWGTAAAGADIIAYAAGTTRHYAFSYNRTSSMFNGYFANGMRVGFFATEATSAVLNANGKRLLQEAFIRASKNIPFD